MSDNEWKPTYRHFSESRISLCENGVMAVKNRGQLCICYQVLDDDPYRGGAALFWKDPSHVYLRFNWDSWISVDCETPDVLLDIHKQRTASLDVCYNNVMTSHPLRVYHIDELPKELFGDPDSPDDAPDDSSQADAEDPFLEPIDQASSAPDEEGDDDVEEESPPEEEEDADLTQDDLFSEAENELHGDDDTTGNADFEEMNRFFATLMSELQEQGVPQNLCGSSYDAYLAKKSKANWKRFRDAMKQILEADGIDYFPHVKLDGENVDDAFSTSSAAVLIDVYRGRSSLARQIKALTKVAEKLKDGEPDGRIQKAIFFGESICTPPLPDGFLALTPDNISELISWFKKP